MTNTTVSNIWQSHKLGEMAEEVRNLFEPIGAGEYPYVGLEHIEQGTLQLNSIGKSTDTVSTKKQFNAGEILFGSLRPYFRKVVRLNFNGVCSTDITVIRPKKNCNSGFLQYFIANQAFIDHATNISSGTRMPRANWKTLCESEWEFPLLPTQRKIAAILSAYDDLIENNLRRIKILEEMAQNLYREWFVKFRFPGHQHACFTDSLLGRIPEAWKFQRLDELCSAVLDGDWIETKDQGGEDYRLLQISNIGLGDFVETGKFRYVTQETFDRLRCTEILPDDLLIARMPAPIGRGWLARKMPWRTITAVDVAIARPDSRRISPVFLVHFWNQPSTLAAIEKQSSGTTRLRITKRGLCAMPIPTPPLDLQEQFSAKARPMLDLCNILRDKNTSLRRTRDLLLPRLISGEVDVSALDIAVPEEASA